MTKRLREDRGRGREERETEREGRRERVRERGGVKGAGGREGGSTQGSTCLTKDSGEASLLCHDAWSHQWPSKSPVRWEGGHIHTREDIERDK